jgi:hypothetical protein
MALADAQKHAEKRLKYEEQVYWEIDDSGSRIDGPFCPNCFDADRKVIRLTPHKEKGLFRCTFHKSWFATGEYKPSHQPSMRTVARFRT